MNLKQYFGYDKNENKVTGMHTAELRRRGAIGQMFHEEEVYDSPKVGWIVVVQCTNEQGWLPNPLRINNPLALELTS